MIGLSQKQWQNVLASNLDIGESLNSSAPPVDDDVGIIAARSVAGKHTVSISATRCQADEPAAAHFSSDTIQ